MSEAFRKILEKIEDFHKKMDELLKDCTDVEKAFILGTYVWDCNVRKTEKVADKEE